MPVRYRQKEFLSGGYYHVYNRGVDGRIIFEENKDYGYFLRKLRECVVEGEGAEVAAYCLMPEHFHLLVKQNNQGGLTKLMRRLVTSYVMYFNKRVKRRGPLFENIYRAVLLSGTKEEVVWKVKLVASYLHSHTVTRTEIRLGPIKTVSATDPKDYPYSSYVQYTGLFTDKWVKCDYVFEKEKFSNANEFQAQLAKHPEAEDLLFDYLSNK